ncbi:MAG: ATP-binding cassette domain-containing protein [Coriobacteriia bacterium]|nr:ATP-binding cassette domain-containing protein [Coriobacteriia bacterium]
MAYLALDHLGFRYPDATVPALDDLTLDIDAGAFVVLCGTSGCGKTTLLRQLKPSLTPAGDHRAGQIRLASRPLTELSAREDASQIGFIAQDPDSQIVTDQVYHELAFGLENLGVPSDEIRLRVAEMASFFGIQEWFDQPCNALSGGQKQLLNLAAIMTGSPALLLCDEPTSQLDPIAAAHFLAALKKINDEIGTTVIVSEQRLEEVVPCADRVLVLENGRLVADAAPECIGAKLLAAGSPMFAALPTPIRLFYRLESEQAGVGAPAPTTVRAARTYLQEKLQTSNNRQQPGHPTHQSQDPVATGQTGFCDGACAARSRSAQNDKKGSLASLHYAQNDRKSSLTPLLSLHEVWFRYERNSPDVLRGLALDVYPGELTAIVGGNATGKTTTLNVIAGLLKPYRGRVKRDPRALPAGTGAGATVLLPQDPRLLFTHKTVREELEATLPLAGASKQERAGRLAEVTRRCEIAGLLDRHPFDVSGGEAQRIALADVLLARPRLLLLDEPTKGMDAAFKRRFAELLRTLIATEGLTVVMVSHDIEFCARHADRCVLCFNGEITASAPPRPFFANLCYYTTAARRISRGLLPGAITTGDIVAGAQKESRPA